jgi:hypothetical protein
MLAVSTHKLKARVSMEDVTIIGMDRAKNVLQLKSATSVGSVLFRELLRLP